MQEINIYTNERFAGKKLQRKILDRLNNKSLNMKNRGVSSGLIANHISTYQNCYNYEMVRQELVKLKQAGMVRLVGNKWRLS